MEIPMFIKRCLTYGVKIYPYQLKTILLMAEKYNIPDEKMMEFNHEKTETYINGLYLSGQEMSNDWCRGHDMLKSIGFKYAKQEEGHRSFVSLHYA